MIPLVGCLFLFVRESAGDGTCSSARGDVYHLAEKECE